MSRFLRVLFVIVVVVFAFAFVGFFLDNMENTRISFIYWESIPMPKSLMLVFACLLGIAIGVLAMFSRVWRMHGNLRRMKKDNALMSRELQALRTKPLSARDNGQPPVRPGDTTIDTGDSA